MVTLNKRLKVLYIRYRYICVRVKAQEPHSGGFVGGSTGQTVQSKEKNKLLLIFGIEVGDFFLHFILAKSQTNLWLKKVIKQKTLQA